MGQSTVIGSKLSLDFGTESGFGSQSDSSYGYGAGH